MYPVNPRTVEKRRAPREPRPTRLTPICWRKRGCADFQGLRRLNPDSEQIQELKTLTRDQDALIQMQTRLVNQLTACLKAYYPVALEVFGKLQQPSTLAFLRAYPTLQAARAASVEELATLLKQARYPGARQKAQQLVARLQQPCLQATEVTTRTKARLMLALVAQLEPLLTQIADYDKEIEHLFLSHADSECSSRLCQGPERVLLLDCWPNWATIAAGMRVPAVCKRWLARRRALPERDVSKGPSSLGLYQALAQCLAPICLAKYPFRSLGQGVLPAQANRGEEPYGRGQSPGQCVGAHSLCRLANQGSVSNHHL